MGQAVTFTADIEVPENSGKVVAAGWNFEGLPENSGKLANAFPHTAALIPADKTGSRVTVKTTHTFTRPGTYFPTLRVASQREGDAKTPFTRIQNLDRVRVVVK